jgi:mannose-6-phosphate isomerase-like protein (cupin superfamily)
MHPAIYGNHNQSLAEAVVPVGSTTVLHRHWQSEEIYHIIAGFGVMVAGDEQVDVVAGDTICIIPGTPHQIANAGAIPLRIMCCCAPAYAHGDTELL